VNVLVIGSSGQLARSLHEAAPDNMFISLFGRPEIDLTKPETLIEIFKQKNPEIVVNASAYTAVDKAEEESGLAFAINSAGAEQLAKLCERNSIPLIHVSTDYVFDGSKKTAYLESDPVAPLGTYGLSKLEGEKKIARYCSRHIILRTAWVYSPFGNNFVKTMLRLATSHDEIKVVDDQWGNPTYALHLATAIVKIIPQIIGADIKSSVWGVYHATGSGETNWYDFATEIFRCSASYGAKSPIVRQITIAEYPTRAKRPANSMLDCKKLETAFNIRLPDWREGTKDCVKRLLV